MNEKIKKNETHTTPFCLQMSIQDKWQEKKEKLRLRDTKWA